MAANLTRYKLRLHAFSEPEMPLRLTAVSCYPAARCIVARSVRDYMLLLRGCVVGSIFRNGSLIDVTYRRSHAISSHLISVFR